MAQLATSLISGIGGSLLSGLGGRSGSTSSGTRNSTSRATTDQFNEAVEDPQFAEFRQMLLPMFMGLLEQSQQPVYTDDRIAKTLRDINQQFSKAEINPTLAARGLLGSGLARTMAADVDNARAATASNFFQQVPALEREARFNNLMGALGLGANFAGRAPVSQRLTGEQTQTNNETFSGTQTGGQGFGSAFATNLGGWLGSGAGQRTIGRTVGLGGGWG